MKKRILAVFAVLALLAGAAVAVYADAQVVITGGSLSQTPQSIGFTATLTGAAQTVTDNDVTDWAATDPTGTGAGWHITILAEDFCDTVRDATCVDPDALIDASNFKVKLTTAIVTVDGNAPPTSSIATYTSFDTVQTLLSAALTEGMGSYTYVPDFSLDIAADTYAGTYGSTVTVAIVSGP